jgi:hypothetical protein
MAENCIFPPCSSVLLIANFFIFCAKFFFMPVSLCVALRPLTIKFLPNHEGIIKPRSDQWCQWRSAVSRFWVLLRVSLCPLWFKRLLSALISENQRQKGFDLLRASASQPALERSEGWWVLILVAALPRCVLCGSLWCWFSSVFLRALCGLLLIFP